jgi:hypothetical protein
MTHDQSPHEIPGAYHAGSRQFQDRFDCRRINNALHLTTARPQRNARSQVSANVSASRP